MYSIQKDTKGVYHCEGELQDGHENWTEVTLQAAIDSMKTFAKSMNGQKIKKKDIAYYEQVSVQTIQLKQVKL